MIITDENIDDQTVKDLREDFIRSCGCRYREEDGVMISEGTVVPLSFNDISDLGLLYKINKEVLHPLGIALTRTLGGLSMGAVVTKDGQPISYDEPIVKKREVDLDLLETRLHGLRLAFSSEVTPVAEAKPTQVSINTKLNNTFAVSPKPMSAVDRINKEGINFSKFPLFYELTNTLKLGNITNVLVRNTLAKAEGRSDKFNSRLPRNIDDLTGLIAYMVYILDEYFNFITFEGIDATGKQTISNILKDYLAEMRELKNLLSSQSNGNGAFVSTYTPEFNNKDFLAANENAPINIEIHKQNIPDYNIGSGKEILRILQTKPDTNTLKYLFGVNRLEVQNRYEHSATRMHSTSIRIYDRYVESSIAFTLAKELIKKDWVPKHNYSYSVDDKIGDCMIDRNKLERDTVQDIENLEYNQFKLVKPKLMILCHAPIEVIEARLQERSKHTQLDKHETDIRLLNTTQWVYHKLANTRIDRQAHDVLKVNTHQMDPKTCVSYILQWMLDTSFKRVLGIE